MKATTQTIDNMQSAYKGEMTATAKYEAFSKKAQEEGLHSIAVLYNAVSVAESIHARNHKATHAQPIEPGLLPRAGHLGAQ